MAAFFAKIWDWLVKVGAGYFAPFAVFLALYFGLLDFIAGEAAVFLNSLLNYTIPGVNFALADGYVPLSRINRFIPLYENVVCFIGFHALSVAFVIYRFIKSHIPTMGN